MWRNHRYTMDYFLSRACPGQVKGNAPLWVPRNAGWTKDHQESSGHKMTPVSEEGDSLKDLSRLPPTSLVNKGTLIQR